MVLAVLLACAVVALIYAVSRARRAERLAREHEESCQFNLAELENAAMNYATDHGNRLPPAERWEQELGPYLEGLTYMFRCPARDRSEAWAGTDYAFNAALSGKALAEIEAPLTAVLFFETSVTQAADGSRSVADPLTSFATPHRSGGMVAYVDGGFAALRSPPVQAGPSETPGE